jgi:hypothetical protein
VDDAGTASERPHRAWDAQLSGATDQGRPAGVLSVGGVCFHDEARVDRCAAALIGGPNQVM